MKVPAVVRRVPRRFRALATAAGLLVAASAALLGAAPAQAAPAGLPGIDVSHYQGSINWSSVKGSGIRFAYIKATEGTSVVDSAFSANYTGAYNAGVIRGAYHFARPGSSSGAAQANYFAAHGGAWSADNLTLPGALDLEVSGCDGLSASAMVSWIKDFTSTYKADTGRDAVLYTTASWWSSCTGGSTAFGSSNPMWVAHWGVSSPSVPAGWGTYTFWQYADNGSVSGISGAVDTDVFNGSADRLLALANNTP
ncbi:GH25 family lysozyme [Actinocatenispora comari]|uniref:lysozyme n=1 Tax=Actinocatenispora comari TaxID=2807577 RepID=A0A8J4A6R4_9ACTN|nr:GH25 family lysozyme [Actinocatenispora comari]GIL25979.1 hydrolase [Actinocatenispora comari]